MAITRYTLDPITEKSIEQLGGMIVHVDQLINQCVSAIPGTIENEMMIPLLIHRHLLQKVDSIHSNIDAGTEDASKAIMRTLLENLIYLLFILDGDTEEKAKAYHLGWLKSQLSHMQKVQVGHPKQPVIESFIGKDFYHAFPESEVTAEIESVKKKINEPWLRHTKKKWEKVERERRKRGDRRFVNWHSLFGKDTIKQVAISVSMEAEYEVIYSIYSDETHSTNAMNMLETQSGKGYFKPLRTYNDPETIISTATTFLWRATDVILQKFFPEHQLPFSVYSLVNQGSSILIKDHLEELRLSDPDGYEKAVSFYAKNIKAGDLVGS